MLVQPAYADWDYMSKEEMVSYADAIAVATIAKVENCAEKVDNGSQYPHTYHQKASATVEQVLKGKLPAKITIYGAINAAGAPLMCVPDAKLQAGRCLVFLRDEGKKGSSFVSANADLGIRPILTSSSP
jgi:hypothetical protein